MYVFIYFWLCWIFVSVWGLSLVAASGGHSSSWCAGLSLLRPLLLRSTSSRRAGSVVVAHGPSCSVACGIFPDQGSNPCPLHWQADSQPLRHQGSPTFLILMKPSLSIICIMGCVFGFVWYIFCEGSNPIYESSTFITQRPYLQIPSHWGLSFNIWICGGYKHSVIAIHKLHTA